MSQLNRPMHPRKRLAWIIHETSQLITDVASWNENNPDHPPFDCEAERVTLAIAQQAADEWDRGDIAAAMKTMDRLATYATEQLESEAK